MTQVSTNTLSPARGGAAASREGASFWPFALLALAGLSPGCDLGAPAPEPEYRLSQESLEVLRELGEQADATGAAISAELRRHFGTPADARLPRGEEQHEPGAELDLRAAAASYREECQHCHGVEGGGDGPTGSYMKPRPRDFRAGLFKWGRVEYGGAPTHEDLVRILYDGVPGTSMGSFSKLESSLIEGLASYVQLLSMRGELERLLVLDAVEAGGLDEACVAGELELVRARWARAPRTRVEIGAPMPAPTPERLARGRKLFLGDGLCASCHGSEGEGNGSALSQPDEHGQSVPRLDGWGQPTKARNLTRGNYRGGSQAADIYRRIRGGITGTIMPAAPTTLSEEDIWSLVLYVLSLDERRAEARSRELAR